MISAKMTGGIYDLKEEDVRSRLNDFIDLIDGYGVAQFLSGDETEIIKKYILQDVNGLKVQTVIGKNYRVNLYEDDSLEAIFVPNGLNYEAVQNFMESINKLSFEHNTTYGQSTKGLRLKSIVKIKVKEDPEEIMRLLALFKIL